MAVIEIHAPPSFDGSEGLLAVIARAESGKETDVNFVTDPKHEQQVAISVYAKDHIIKPHYHPRCERTIKTTSEVIILREGKMLVDIFTTRGEWVNCWTLNAGDLIILLAGGHSFKFMENSELVEVKQGPYLGNDKVYY